MQGKIRIIPALYALTVLGSAHAAEADDGSQLRAQVTHSYPSLRDVERYRHDFPDEVQGHAFWSVDHAAFFLPDADALTRALAALQDQHVALVGAKAGRSETLGMLFRTVSDGSVIVWRVFDASTLNYVSPMQFENHWLAAQAARFPVQRDLDTFDFTQTTINEAQLRELHRCALLNEARNLVFVGGPGTGKTHLAMALGRAAIRSHGKRV